MEPVTDIKAQVIRAIESAFPGRVRIGPIEAASGEKKHLFYKGMMGDLDHLKRESISWLKRFLEVRSLETPGLKLLVEVITERNGALLIRGIQDV